MGRMWSLSELAATAIHPTIVAALREASSLLRDAGVRHAAVGALAVGVHGWPRATADVDLLLAPEAWHTAPDGTQTPRTALPDEIGGITIDCLPIDVAGDFLLEAFDRPLLSEGVPIAPAEVVILTKLIRLVMRDQADIVELLKAGTVDERVVRRYLDEHAPMLTSRFDALSAQARLESEKP